MSLGWGTLGELNIEVRNTRDGRVWTYWPTR